MTRELPGISQYDPFELSLTGPTEGNPFTDVTVGARFELNGHVQDVAGFYDGDGVYRVRFMPDAPGVLRYRTASNRPELDGRAGERVVVPAQPGNHGPVRVWNTFHFRYDDGTPYLQMGTTCYAWVHQGADLRRGLWIRWRRRRSTSYACACFPSITVSITMNRNSIPIAPRGWRVGFHPVRSGVLPALRATGGSPARPGHPGRHHPVPPV